MVQWYRDLPRSVYFAKEVLVGGNLDEDEERVVLAGAHLRRQSDLRQSFYELLKAGDSSLLV
jgi:hypothetical protein